MGQVVCFRVVASKDSILLDNKRISDRNRIPNKLAYNIELSYFYAIKIAKLYVIS